MTMEPARPSSSSSQGAEKSEAGRTRRHRVLLAACGSVAAVKFFHLCLGFSQWADVVAVATQPALRFIDRDALSRNVVLCTDVEEWSSWKRVGDNVLHIELRKWADVMVIAPLSANTLAKIAGGVCDNLLTSIVRAWEDYNSIFIAPSMNTYMWNNQFTEKHLLALDDMGFNLIPPVHTKLPSGEYGNGAMAEPSHINKTVRMFLESHGSSSASGGV